MVVVIAVVIGIALITVLVALLLARRRRSATEAQTPAPAPARRPDPTPMTGLEDALNALTDRSGQTIAARLDEEAPTVDELRVPDDTGPLLRRVLDSLETTSEPADADGAAEQDDAAGPTNASGASDA